MKISEFVELGFLQEINRLVLHPCGLAIQLTVNETENGTECIAKIIDARDDEEGIIFDKPSKEKALLVDAERRKHYPARADHFSHLDHKSESFSIHLKYPDQYIKNNRMVNACHPPDVQPAE